MGKTTKTPILMEKYAPTYGIALNEWRKDRTPWTSTTAETYAVTYGILLKDYKTIRPPQKSMTAETYGITYGILLREHKTRNKKKSRRLQGIGSASSKGAGDSSEAALFLRRLIKYLDKLAGKTDSQSAEKKDVEKNTCENGDCTTDINDLQGGYGPGEVETVLYYPKNDEVPLEAQIRNVSHPGGARSLSKKDSKSATEGQQTVQATKVTQKQSRMPSEVIKRKSPRLGTVPASAFGKQDNEPSEVEQNRVILPFTGFASFTIPSVTSRRHQAASPVKTTIVKTSSPSSTSRIPKGVGQSRSLEARKAEKSPLSTPSSTSKNEASSRSMAHSSRSLSPAPAQHQRAKPGTRSLDAGPGGSKKDIILIIFACSLLIAIGISVLLCYLYYKLHKRCKNSATFQEYATVPPGKSLEPPNNMFHEEAKRLEKNINLNKNIDENLIHDEGNMNPSNNTETEKNMYPDRNTNPETDMHPERNIDPEENIDPGEIFYSDEDIDPDEHIDTDENTDPDINIDPGKNSDAEKCIHPKKDTPLEKNFNPEKNFNRGKSNDIMHRESNIIANMNRIPENKVFPGKSMPPENSMTLGKSMCTEKNSLLEKRVSKLNDILLKDVKMNILGSPSKGPPARRDSPPPASPSGTTNNSLDDNFSSRSDSSSYHQQQPERSSYMARQYEGLSYNAQHERSSHRQQPQVLKSSTESFDSVRDRKICNSPNCTCSSCRIRNSGRETKALFGQREDSRDFPSSNMYGGMSSIPTSREHQAPGSKPFPTAKMKMEARSTYTPSEYSDRNTKFPKIFRK